jgi:hypothetical protein
MAGSSAGFWSSNFRKPTQRTEGHTERVRGNCSQRQLLAPIDAFVPAEARSFWRAVLGYQEVGDEYLLDPYGRWPSICSSANLRFVTHMSPCIILPERGVAVIEKEHRGVADPDQAYILGELIRCLEHPRSGALEFEDMGSSRLPVRNAVADRTLRQNNPGATVASCGRSPRSSSVSRLSV